MEAAVHQPGSAMVFRITTNRLHAEEEFKEVQLLP